MPQFKPIATQNPEGWYVAYSLISHRKNFVDVWSTVDSAEVKNKVEARSWFKSRIASFLGVPEENLTPLWFAMLPKQLQ